MADIQDILSGLQPIDNTNANNNSFIDLMKDIAGNPSDATAPVDDPNSIYGQIVILYNEMVAARASDAEITAAINKIVNLSVEVTDVPSGTPGSGELVGSELQLSIPSGANGEDGDDGRTPILSITYNETTGFLESEVVDYE